MFDRERRDVVRRRGVVYVCILCDVNLIVAIKGRERGIVILAKASLALGQM